MENVEAVEKQKKNMLINRNFALLFYGKLVSQIGDGIYNLAVSWFILSLTGSSLQMGIYLATCTFIFMIFTPISGVLADKFNRIKIIYWMDFIRGFAVTIAAVFIYLNISEFVTLLVLYITAITLNIAGSLFAPTSMAVVPELVDESDLTNANSFLSMVQQFSSIIGVIAGGVIYGIIGPFGVFALNASSYLLSGLSETFIKPSTKREETRNKTESFLEQLKYGFRYIISNKGLTSIIGFAVFMNFLLPPIFAVYLPYIFNQTLNVTVINLSITDVAISVGGIFGAIALTKYKKEIDIKKTFIYGSCILFILITLLPVLLYFRTNGVLVHLLFMILLSVVLMIIGVTLSIINIPVYTTLQKNVKQEIQGRIFSIVMTLCQIAMPLGVLLFGWLISKVSIIPALISNVIVLAVVIIVMIIKRNAFKVDFVE